jgi:uncharacterized membrane protein
MEWLGNTPVSTTMQTVKWIVPTVQSIHIMAVAFLTASVVLIDMCLLRSHRPGAGLSVTAMVERFAPWTRRALAVLLVTGGSLILAEPHRELANPVFWSKMALIVVVCVVTLLFQSTVRRHGQSWDMGRYRLAGIAFAMASMVLWGAIIVCGRWIAYVEIQ